MLGPNSNVAFLAALSIIMFVGPFVVAFYTDALTGFAFFMTVTSVARLRGRDT